MSPSGIHSQTTPRKMKTFLSFISMTVEKLFDKYVYLNIVNKAVVLNVICDLNKVLFLICQIFNVNSFTNTYWE